MTEDAASVLSATYGDDEESERDADSSEDDDESDWSDKDDMSEQDKENKEMEEEHLVQSASDIETVEGLLSSTQEPMLSRSIGEGTTDKLLEHVFKLCITLLMVT